MMDSYADFDLVLEQTTSANGAGSSGEPGFGYPTAPSGTAEETKPALSYLARVTGSPAGRAQAEFTLPFEQLEIENFALKLGHRRGMRRIESSSSAEARAFGKRLFDAVFCGDVATAYVRSIDEAKRSGSGLRIRLRLEDQQLASIPWEFLHYAAQDDFLVLSKQTPLVRVLDVPRQLRSNEIELPLRILVMVSSPNDQDSLDVEAEYERLATAMADRIESGHIEMVRVSGSMSELQRALRQSRFHIFHFIGHGGFDQANDDGVLVLESATGSSEFVPGSKLGTLLYDEPSLQLVMLNACEAGRASGEDPFGGVAQSLIRKGMPAVIAMQFEISDTAAIVLSHDFYGALSDGLPVDAALAEARKAIYAASDGVEWGTPVLYLQNSSGQLFNVTQTLPAPKVSTAPDLAPREITKALIDPPQITRQEPVEPAQATPPDPTPPKVTPRAATRDIRETLHYSPGAEPPAPEPIPIPIPIPISDSVPSPAPRTSRTPAPAATAHAGAGVGAGADTAKKSRAPLIVGGVLALVAILGVIGLLSGDGDAPASDQVLALTETQPEQTDPEQTDPEAAAEEPTAEPTTEPTTEPTAEPTAEPTPQVLVLQPDDIIVPRLTTPPVIDGAANDWQITDFRDMQGVVYRADWNGTATAGASFAMGHDDNFLYLIMQVGDDVHDQVNNSDQIYRGDAVNINIASASSAELSAPAVGDTQLTMAYSEQLGHILNWWTGNGAGFGTSLGDFQLVSFTTQEIPSEWPISYILEASIPKSLLPDDPARILVSLNDSDGANNQTVVFGHLARSADFSNDPNPIFQSPNQWGRLVLE